MSKPTSRVRGGQRFAAVAPGTVAPVGWRPTSIVCAIVATARRLRAVAFVTVTLGLVGPTPDAVAQERGEIGIAVGSQPEAVVVEDLDGNPVDLADYIGNTPILLEFWASWCENCEALQPDMDAAHEKYGDQVAFVALAVAVNQSQRRVKRHLEEAHPVAYPVLWDARGQGVRAFLAPATSYVVVLDGTGIVTYTGIGPDQDLDAAVRSAIE